MGLSRALLRSDGESLTARRVGARADALSFPPDLPLHVLDLAGTRPRSSGRITFHRWSAELPLSQLVSLGGEAYALGPELLLLEMARWVDEVDLILLGHELCGGYRIDRSRVEGIASAAPLTTVRAIARCVERNAGVAGVKRLRRVLPYIGEGAESPMETALALIVGLPMSRGGLGAPKPVLNYRLDPGRRRRAAAEKSHCRCDLYWPDRCVAVNYVGERAHMGTLRISADTRRRAALQAMGVTMVSVTRDQLYRPDDFRRLVKTLRQVLGLRSRVRCADYPTRQDQLRAKVLGIDRAASDLARPICFG